MQDNYAAEPLALRHLFESNIGLSLNKKNTLWLDAGIFASHIGFESAISLDNLTLTRSLLADNSPYFLSGAKLTYSPNAKLTAVALICNGWQRIQRLQGNSLPAFGTQLAYKFSDAFALNWSTFICSERADSARQMRYFQNLYALGTIGKFQYTVGFDVGMQQIAPQSQVYEPWYSPVVIAAYQWHKRWRVAARAEYYHSPDGFIVPLPANTVLRVFSSSLNLDYKPTADIAFRIEGRYLRSRDDFFINSAGDPSQPNFFLLTSLSARFSK